MKSREIDTRATVLIVEDDADLLETLAKSLRRRDFDVLTAATAAEALALAEKGQIEIDVIVIDIVLPDSWGSQVALAHTAFQPDTRFVYMSGHAKDDAVLRASMEIDEIPFLEKPFQIPELSRAIESVLEEKQRAPGPAE